MKIKFTLYNPALQDLLLLWCEKYNVPNPGLTIINYRQVVTFTDNQYYTLFALTWDTFLTDNNDNKNSITQYALRFYSVIEE
jgi:hypothetical protein